MDKLYVVDFLSSFEQKKSRLSAPKTIDGLEMSTYLEALILERSKQNYTFVSIQVHNELHTTYGFMPTGYLVTFKLKEL